MNCYQFYKSLIAFVHKIRDNFDEFEQTASSYVKDPQCKVAHKHFKLRKRFFDETPEGLSPKMKLSPKEQFRVGTLNSINCIITELNKKIGCIWGTAESLWFSL
jgi:hypothetical protein